MRTLEITRLRILPPSSSSSTSSTTTTTTTTTSTNLLLRALTTVRSNLAFIIHATHSRFYISTSSLSTPYAVPFRHQSISFPGPVSTSSSSSASHPSSTTEYESRSTANESLNTIYIFGTWNSVAQHRAFLSNEKLRTMVLGPQEGVMGWEWGGHVAIEGWRRERDGDEEEGVGVVERRLGRIVAVIKMRIQIKERGAQGSGDGSTEKEEEIEKKVKGEGFTAWVLEKARASGLKAEVAFAGPIDDGLEDVLVVNLDGRGWSGEREVEGEEAKMGWGTRRQENWMGVGEWVEEVKSGAGTGQVDVDVLEVWVGRDMER